MKNIIKIKWIIILSLIFNFTINLKSQINFVYGKQYGSDREGVAYNPVVDKNGNVYIAGETLGVLADRSFGKADGFVSKFDSVGNLIWTKQFGTSEDDKINWLAIDKNAILYAVGYTKGVIKEKNFGNEDILVVKLDSAGTIEWQNQYGTDSTDIGSQIFADNNENIYITGTTKGLMGKQSFGKTDCLLLKLDNNGNKIWTKQFGSTEDDACIGITKDNASNIFVCGYSWGDLAMKNKGKMDAFIGKFTDTGDQLKLFQFGTKEWDMVSSIAIDKEKNIFVGGSTAENFGGKQQGEGDGFLSKLNENFDLIWTQQFGTNKWDGILGIALNENISENIVVSGCQNWPACQSFVRMYTKNGNLLWVNNYTATAKNGGTCGKGVCIDNKGNIYHSGMTGGNLFKSIIKPEGHDIFLIKLCMDKVQTIY